MKIYGVALHVLGALERVRRDDVRTGGEPGVTVSWVAGQIGMSESTARVALSRLTVAGEAERVRNPLSPVGWLYRLP